MRTTVSNREANEVGERRLRANTLFGTLSVEPEYALSGKEQQIMAGGKTFKRDQKRRKEMARKLKQEEKLRKKQERRLQKKGDGGEEELEDSGLQILDPNVPI
jgi:hypothetical protein